MTKYISALVITASFLNAGYDMAFAKASKEIKIKKPASVKVVYTMHEMLKKDFQTYMEKALNTSDIKIDENVPLTITIIPLRFGTPRDLAFSKDGDSIPASSVPWSPPEIINQKSETTDINLPGSAKKTFTDGVSMVGSEGAYSTVAKGVQNMAKTGLITVGLGMVGYGVDSFWTSSDKYMMVTDVMINNERTRIFGILKDGSTIKPSEAMTELSRLTVEKLISMVGDKK